MNNMIRYGLFFLTIHVSCSSIIQIENEAKTVEELDFSACSIASESYKVIRIDVPKGYSKKLIENEGICEYRFSFKDGSILYISNDVWFGSSLNDENRNLIGHESYNKTQLLDTILLNGIQPNKLNWCEHILGDFMIGYVNATESKKSMFEKSLLTIIKHD